MTLAETPPTGQIVQTGMDGWHVFTSWVFTPTGAILTLLLIALGVATGIMRAAGRSVRILLVLIKVAATLLVVWIVGGILEAWGVPVRETIATIGSWIPGLVQSVGGFLQRLFETAG